MVGLTARVLLPPTVDRGFLSFYAAVAAGLSLVFQATLPLIIVLRRSRADGPEVLLADVFLPSACLFGRPVWLSNPRDRLISGSLRRYSPYALLGQLIALAALGWWLVRHFDILEAAFMVVLTIWGSTVLLDASVGNPRAHAASFVIAFLAAGPIPPSLLPLGQLARFSAIFIGTYGTVYAVWSIGRRLAVFGWNPLNDRIRNGLDLIWLRAEMVLPLCFVTRFIHGGPAVIREIKSTNELWRAAVLLLLKRGRHIIMDVSAIDLKSELAWELGTSYQENTKILLTCNAVGLDNALRCVRLVLPRAIILPMDFSDIDKLRTIGHPKVAIIQLFTYGEGRDKERFSAQSGVFFGQVSLREWHNAIRSAQ